MKFKYRHTIFTPVYNREYMIEYVYESIQKLDYPRDKFEWLIIDDGSTDNLKQKIDHMIDESVDINIRYIYKENGGIHTAMNCAIKNAAGEFVTRIDSDDMIIEDALLNKDKAIENIPKDKYDSYIGVVGLCINKADMLVRGNKFPLDIIDTTGIELHRKYKIKGDKNFCMKTEIMRQYPIPEYTDTKWVPEGIIWHRIDRKYITRFINVGLSICAEPNKNSMSGIMSAKNKSSEAYLSRFYGSLHTINEFDDTLSRYEYIGRLGLVLITGICSRKYHAKDVIHLLNTRRKKIYAMILIPFAYLYITFNAIREKYKN